jgi:hypothetical protein
LPGGCGYWKTHPLSSHSGMPTISPLKPERLDWNHYYPKLQKEGYKKIGFIIVSNSFKSNYNSFINEITGNTDIKRFILLTSEALLYLFAYKMKDRPNLSNMIDSLIGFGNPITPDKEIDEFEDV